MRFTKLMLLTISMLTTLEACESNQDSVILHSCVYLDAHWLECWWEEPTEAAVNYRLAYLKESDPFENMPFYTCTDTKPKHALPPPSVTGMRMRSCAFLAHMFSTYQIYIVTEECTEGTYLCHNISHISFEANPSYVYLISAPSHVEVNKELMMLNWRAPDRHGTMLSFALFERKVRYQVSIRKIETTHQWKTFYEGYQTQIFLPQLELSTKYEIRVEAKLDPPAGNFLHEVNVHDWGSSEVRTNLTTTTIANHFLSKPEDEIETRPEVNHHDETNRKVVVTAVVLSVCVFFICIVVFLIFYCNIISCKKERKIGKPLLLVDLTKQTFHNARQTYGSSNQSQSENVKKFAPISSLLRKHSRRSMIPKEQHRLQNSLPTSSFENFERAEFVPTVLNDSILINEELSEVSDSMCKSYIRQTPMLPSQIKNNNTTTGLTSFSTCHNTYIDSNASTDSSPYSLPNYIWGPKNSGYTSCSTSPSVSGYVFGMDLRDSVELKNKTSTPRDLASVGNKNNVKNKVCRPKSSNNIEGLNVINAFMVKEINHIPPMQENNEVVVVITCPHCNNINCCKYSITCEAEGHDNESVSRPNSFSDNSVDSGYSPDSLDATTAV